MYAEFLFATLFLVDAEMDTQTDVNLPRPQMTLRNMNSGNAFYMPLTSFAGKQSLAKCIYLLTIERNQAHK